MTITWQENKEFLKEVVSNSLLDDAVDWIKHNIRIEEVYDEATIIKFVTDNVDVDDVYHDAAIIKYVTDAFNPSEVFSEHELADWAAFNGWVRE